MNGRDKFERFRFLLYFFSKIFKFFPKFICNLLWHCSMPFNGMLSKSLRYVLLKAKAYSIGDNVSIGANTIIKHWENFSCGDNVSIHEFCMIDCDGKITIGSNVSIAHATSLVAANHTWNDISNPIKYNPITKIGITIKDDVWIGCGTRILDGVVINNRSIVAAGAVVNKEVEANSLVGGVPAKIIKNI